MHYVKRDLGKKKNALKPAWLLLAVLEPMPQCLMVPKPLVTQLAQQLKTRPRFQAAALGNVRGSV